MANILDGIQKFGQDSGIGAIANLLVDAGKETNNPGYLLHKRRLDMAESGQNLSGDLAMLRTIQNPQDQQAYFNQMMGKYPQLKSLQGKTSQVMFEQQAKKKTTDKYKQLSDLGTAAIKFKNAGLDGVGKAVGDRARELLTADTIASNANPQGDEDSQLNSLFENIYSGLTDAEKTGVKEVASGEGGVSAVVTPSQGPLGGDSTFKAMQGKIQKAGIGEVLGAGKVEAALLKWWSKKQTEQIKGGKVSSKDLHKLPGYGVEGEKIDISKFLKNPNPVSVNTSLPGERPTEETENPAVELLTGEFDKAPQETKRKWYDDTISPEDVKSAVNTAVELLTNRGYSDKEAQSLVASAFNKLAGEDTGTFKKYPVQDYRSLFSGEAETAEVGTGATTETAEPNTQPAGKALSDYFQTSTETVPDENIPKTFEQAGAQSPQQQQTLQEMQKAIPDVDLKTEYQADPANMERLMKLWQQKKIDKTKLKDFFSKMQQQAKSSLGIS